ncbi:head GIN domain-containing protein [Pedobacter sp.]|uniref:head GIN domain-containing protein n=1 Tax=Pedobacter sp. TaxID=1411316 RepID=UPI003D7F67C7
MPRPTSYKFLSTLMLLCIGFSLTSLAQQTKTVAVQNFTDISVASGIDLYLRQGNSEGLKITSSAELLKDVIIEKKGTSLTIRYKNNVNWERIVHSQKIKAYVTYKTLNALSASGGSDVYSQNTIKSSHFAIHSSGGSDVKLDLMTSNLELHSSGGSDVDLRGKATNMEIHASGGSDINAYDFVVENARVNTSGGSDVNIHVTKALEASASGGSEVHFKGNAALKDNSSKSGGVKRVN